MVLVPLFAPCHRFFDYSQPCGIVSPRRLIVGVVAHRLLVGVQHLEHLGGVEALLLGESEQVLDPIGGAVAQGSRPSRGTRLSPFFSRPRK